MKAYGWDNAFSLASDKCIVRKSNKPPAAADWGSEDDTLATQAGHGICKGLATAWVIAILNGVNEAYDTSKFHQYFNEVLRFQGTYIKDFGKHIDSHLIQLSKMKCSGGLLLIKEKRVVNISSADLVGYNWGAYASVWHHDIGFARRSGKFYIMEPNFGLFCYASQSDFLSDAHTLVEARRARKHQPPTATIGLWFYGKAT